MDGIRTPELSTWTDVMVRTPGPRTGWHPVDAEPDTFRFWDGTAWTRTVHATHRHHADHSPAAAPDSDVRRSRTVFRAARLLAW